MLTASKSQASCFLFTLTLLALAVPALQAEWQGTGNMTESNMTQIKTLIAENPIDTGALSTQWDDACQNISIHLNDLWNPAWNVVVTQITAKISDAILYGYAFRGHWMWFNALPAKNGADFVSFVIWKDYNCIQWQRINSTGGTFTSEEQTQINTQLSSITINQVNNDLWNTAYTLVKNLEATAEFTGAGLSVVVVQ